MAQTKVPVSMIEGLIEQIQDTIGASLAAGTNVTITYNDATGFTQISASSGGGGGGSISDGDKGDIVVSSAGTVWTIDSSVMTNFARDLCAAVNAAAGRTVLGLGTAATAATGDFAAASHSHVIADTTGLQTALDGKAATSHTHTAANVTDFSEAVDDRVAALLVAGTNITLTYDDGSNTLTIAAAGSGGVADGDKGDIVVSASGATWTIDSSVLTTFGRTLTSAADAAAGRSALGLGTAATSASTAFAAASHTHASTDISDSTAAGRALLTGADAAAQRSSLGLGTAATSASSAFAASTHTHVATDISNSTVIGRSVLTAADAAAVRTAIAAYASTGGALSGPASNTIAGGAAKGSVSSGTATFAYGDGNKQTITVAGAHTWAFSGWPSSGTYAEIMLLVTNAGAATITLPTINWVKGDGTSSTTFSSMGVTLQASGRNHFIIWTNDGGTTLYGKAF